MSTNMATTNLRLKLLVDTKSNRVLFAEVGKDVVDFLFGLLSVPVGAITKPLINEQMVGSIGSLYTSIQNLDQTYFLSDQNKNILLNPTSRSLSSNGTLLLTGAGSVAAKYYRCQNNDSYRHKMCTRITDVYGIQCPSCGEKMKVEMHYVDPNLKEVGKGKEGVGFVKGVVTYTVADDLTVMPMSAISSMTMLNKFNVTDVGALEEFTVKLGMKEGLALLKSSLQSKTVLTDVFLRKNNARRRARNW